MAVSNLILPVVEVPDVEESIDTGQVEETTTLWGPAAISEVGSMVTGLHNWGTEVLMPDLCLPVTNREEVFGVAWVTPEGIHWSVMLSRLVTETPRDIELLPLVCLHNVALLAANQVVEGTGLSEVLK